jgi:hypothetical protein
MSHGNSQGHQHVIKIRGTQSQTEPPAGDFIYRSCPSGDLHGQPGKWAGYTQTKPDRPRSPGTNREQRERVTMECLIGEPGAAIPKLLTQPDEINGFLEAARWDEGKVKS